MIHYLNILLAAAAEPWLLQREKLSEVTRFLLAKGGGAMFSASEIEARIGKGVERQVARSEGEVGVIPVYGLISQRMNLMQEFSGGVSTQMVAAEFQVDAGRPGREGDRPRHGHARWDGVRYSGVGRRDFR